jgi:hypothetical protein
LYKLLISPVKDTRLGDESPENIAGKNGRNCIKTIKSRKIEVIKIEDY